MRVCRRCYHCCGRTVKGRRWPPCSRTRSNPPEPPVCAWNQLVSLTIPTYTFATSFSWSPILKKTRHEKNCAALCNPEVLAAVSGLHDVPDYFGHLLCSPEWKGSNQFGQSSRGVLPDPAQPLFGWLRLGFLWASRLCCCCHSPWPAFRGRGGLPWLGTCRSFGQFLRSSGVPSSSCGHLQLQASRMYNSGMGKTNGSLWWVILRRLRWLAFANNGNPPSEGSAKVELPFCRQFLRISESEIEKERESLTLNSRQNPLQLFLEGLLVNDTLEELDISNCAVGLVLSDSAVSKCWCPKSTPRH
eukprot:symbB.v1.2.017240.t1/scaffold1344.1/size124249/3